MSDESLSLRTVTPEQRRLIDEAQEIADIEERHAARQNSVPTAGLAVEAHADRGRLLALLREARAMIGAEGWGPHIEAVAKLTDAAIQQRCERAEEALRESRAEVARLRAELEPFVRERTAAAALEAARALLDAPRIPPETPQFVAVVGVESPAGPPATPVPDRIRARLLSILRQPEMHGGVEAVALQVLLLLDLLAGRSVLPEWQAYERRMRPNKPSTIPLWDWLQGEYPPAGDARGGIERAHAALREFAAERGVFEGASPPERR